MPSYMAAYPIAGLLNGLLNGDIRFMNETQISQDAVWGIIFELHRIAPNLLTTVTGNVLMLYKLKKVNVD